MKLAAVFLAVFLSASLSTSLASAKSRPSPRPSLVPSFPPKLSAPKAERFSRPAALWSVIEPSALADTASPSTAPSPIPNSLPSTVSATVPVAEAAAPPAWAQDLMVTAQGLPIIGPIVSKALLLLGIVSAVLTSLVAFLLGVIQSLMAVFTWTGLVDATVAIAAFRDGKIMYWLKFFSLFNAKKPEA